MIEPAGAVTSLNSDVSVAPVLDAAGISKSYRGGDGSHLQILSGVSLAISGGESVAIIGQSGAGKSTLLHIVGGLDRPTSGEVLLGGQALSERSDAELARIRNERVGFVFQFHHLLREFTALENVMMPQLIAGATPAAAAERARLLLDEVGLASRLTHRPNQLSGGEQQRVAVARALANRPVLLLADEPTGNLDPSTSDRLHDILFAVSREHASAMVLVTHNLELAARADRTLRVKDGHLVPLNGAAGEGGDPAQPPTSL